MKLQKHPSMQNPEGMPMPYMLKISLLDPILVFVINASKFLHNYGKFECDITKARHCSMHANPVRLFTSEFNLIFKCVEFHHRFIYTNNL